MSRGNDPIVNRRTLADHLMISPNRVSEVVQLGAIQHASKNPLRFGLRHASAFYRSYQCWLRYRRAMGALRSRLASNGIDHSRKSILQKAADPHKTAASVNSKKPTRDFAHVLPCPDSLVKRPRLPSYFRASHCLRRPPHRHRESVSLRTRFLKSGSSECRGSRPP